MAGEPRRPAAAGGAPRERGAASPLRATASTRCCVWPSLAVLVVVTLLPTLYLLVTSFTPLDLTQPETAWNFASPLVNYRLLLEDGRLHNSLLGAGQAVLLDRRRCNC